ncbi:MAG: class I SAM-dependent methyltransferase [Acidimicrobiales bacterium]
MDRWTRYTTAGVRGEDRPTDSLELGPGDVAGLDRRLLGDVSGLRVLDLGCGSGHGAIALARAGARVVAIDPDAAQITRARRNAEEAETHVELHNADLAELAFLHADVFDAVVSVHALSGVSNLGRVFRQVHRVLKPERPLVFTLPHPASLTLHFDHPDTLVADYGDDTPLGEGPMLTHRHGIAHVFTTLMRSNYRVDTLVEPAGEGRFPASVVFRARKLGT